MEILKSIHGRIAVLEVAGPIIEEDLALLDRHVDECLGEGLNRLVIDLAGVPFIDSAGLEHILTNVTRASKSGGNVRLTRLNDVCRDIFSATGVGNYVVVVDETAAAVRSLL